MTLLALACSTGRGPFVHSSPTQHPDITVSFGVDAANAASPTVADAGAASSDTATGSGTVTDAVVQADATMVMNDASDSATSAADSVVGGEDTGAATDASAQDTATSSDSTSPLDVNLTKCGDGKCEAILGESCNVCEADCGKCCGDGKCDGTAGENCGTCALDCGLCCGNKICEADKGESCLSCALDCGSCCGNGKCDVAVNETCSSCPKDCGPCTTCGDGKCEGTENVSNCPKDCQPSTCSLPCDPVTQKGCSTAMQCYPNASSSTCANVGTKKLNGSCLGINECVKGLLCVNQLCKQLCSTKGAAGFTCIGGSKCSPLESGGKQLPCDLGACFGDMNCNLLSNDKCPATHNCLQFSDGVKQCLPAGTKGQGAACTKDNECQKDHMCIGEGAGKPMNCLKKCHAGGGKPACLSGLKCVQVTVGTPPKPAGDSLGVCLK